MHAIVEIGRFYGNELKTEADLTNMIPMTRKRYLNNQSIPFLVTQIPIVKFLILIYIPLQVSMLVVPLLFFCKFNHLKCE